MNTEHEFRHTDRYEFDCGECSYERGFAQIDTCQDAWYFGNWTNPETLEIVTYAEGDIYRKKAATVEEYAAELRRIATFYRDGGSWKGIDPGLSGKMEPRFEALGLSDLLQLCIHQPN